MNNPLFSLLTLEISESAQTDLQTLDYVRISEAVIDSMTYPKLTAVMGGHSFSDPGEDPYPDPPPSKSFVSNPSLFPYDDDPYPLLRLS